MDERENADDAGLDQHYFLVSAASWYISLLDGFYLGPLTSEERKEFRKRYLQTLTSFADQFFRSEPFLEVLDRSCRRGAKVKKDVTRPRETESEIFRSLLENGVLKHFLGERFASPPAREMADEPDRSALENDVLKHFLGERFASYLAEEMASEPEEQRPATKPSAPPLSGRVRRDRVASDRRDREGAAESVTPKSDDVLQELRETTRLLKELIALQQRLDAKRNGHEQPLYGKE